MLNLTVEALLPHSAVSEPSLNGHLISAALTADAIEQMSLIVYQAIVSTQNQQPHWIVEKYRTLPLQQYQSSLTQKLQTGLRQASDQKMVLTRLQQFLQALLEPDFFASSAHAALLEQIDRLLEQKTDQHASQQNLSEPVVSQSAAGIAILLLDAENLKLNANSENFLTSLCAYPIHIKLAFANWKSMGRWDAEFHRRGFQMIHVPPGKNSADMEMTAIGSSISAQYPTVKEVIVCASDRDLMHLRNRLQAQGLVVHSVRNQGKTITVFNHQTGKAQSYTNESAPDPATIPAIDDFITTLKDFVQNEQQQTGNPWVRLSRLSQLFLQQHQITVREVVAAYAANTKTVKEFLMEFSTDFVVHQPLKYSGAYVSLFREAPKISELPAIPTAADTENSATLSNRTTISNDPSGSSVPVFDSPIALSAYLAILLQELLKAARKEYVPIGELGTAFNRGSGQAITTVIKEKLKRNGTFVKYLEADPQFKLKMINEKWYVTLA